MAINDGVNTYRGIYEQVLKNAQDIEAFKQGAETLAQFGISVKGILLAAADLPAVGVSNGDAYLVGEAAGSYNMYIWTNNVQWVNIGRFPAPGPQGVQGPRGAQITGGTVLPTTNNVSGDLFFNAQTDDIYQFSGGSWNLIGNIRGQKATGAPKACRAYKAPQAQQDRRAHVVRKVPRVSKALQVKTLSLLASLQALHSSPSLQRKIKVTRTSLALQSLTICISL